MLNGEPESHRIWREMHELVEYLFFRWQDEGGLEDIAEYGKVIAARLEELGAKFERIEPDPFKFYFTIGDKRYMILRGEEVYGVVPVSWYDSDQERLDAMNEP